MVELEKKQRYVGFAVLALMAAVLSPSFFHAAQMPAQIPVRKKALVQQMNLAKMPQPPAAPRGMPINMSSAPEAFAPKPVVQKPVSHIKAPFFQKPIRRLPKTHQVQLHRHRKTSLPSPHYQPAFHGHHVKRLDWRVQVGVFGQASNAHHLLKRLKSAGYPARVAHLSHTTKWRVQLGPFSSRVHAEKMKGKLMHRMHLHGFIVKERL